MTKQLLALAAAFGLVAGASTGALAQPSSSSPGVQMQENGSVNGSAGASGYTPGHKMQTNGSASGTTGASGYAPGHATTGSSVNGGANLNADGGTTTQGSAGVGTGTNLKVK